MAFVAYLPTTLSGGVWQSLQPATSLWLDFIHAA